jgi:hypothetical protein
LYPVHRRVRARYLVWRAGRQEVGRAGHFKARDCIFQADEAVEVLVYDVLFIRFTEA